MSNPLRRHPAPRPAATAPLAADQELLPRASLERLLGALLLVVAPHLLRLPAWESLLLVALVAWRGLAARRHWRMPHPAIKVALTLAIFAGVYASYGRVWGQNAGIALLLIMLALKLTELRARRDVMVTVFMLYFALVTHFLYSQEIWTVAYLLASVIAITAVLIDVHHAGSARPRRLLLRLAGTLVLQSLPIMLLAFVLFPRLPGPLWALPVDAGAGTPGLSDDMTPGDIGRLALSDAIAFRVRFEGAPPPPAERYWRGPPLMDYDGRTWRQSQRLLRQGPPPVEFRGPAYAYEITLEPTRNRQLLALDLPRTDTLPAETGLTGEYQWLAMQPLRELRRYRLVSQTHFALQPELPRGVRAAALSLPPAIFPKARALAAGWRARFGDGESADAAIVQAALDLIRHEPFVYTLEPGVQGPGGIDEFLFETRRGFCEHYSGAFTFLMRAAGVPARVVTGYLGGDANAFGDWLTVRQADAHAWAEVWLAGRGWVRIDPTQAVAPERVERSVELARSRSSVGSDAIATFDWSGLRARWDAGRDWIDARWNGLVLGYGTERQKELLSRIGLGSWSSMLLALTGSAVGVLAILGLVLMRRSAPAPEDAPLRHWRHAQAALGQRGFELRRQEGPRDFCERVIRSRPDLRAPMEALLAAYLRQRYEAPSDRGPAGDLAAAVAALKRAL